MNEFLFAFRHRFDPVTSQLTTFQLEIMILAALGTPIEQP